jgi:hypothetical protein
MAATRKELILAAAVLLAIPLLAEVALRTAGVQFEPELYEPNRERGWTLRPGASGTVALENRQYVRINSRGSHDVEHTYEKPAHTFRIAVLGNSWTEALQVPVESNYISLLQQQLSASSCFDGKRVEVLNFGVAGYSTAQEFLALKQEVWKYQPDEILLAFYPARDVANNIRELNNASAPEQSPYFVFRGNELVLDDSFQSLPVLQKRNIALQNVRYRISEHLRTSQAIFALQRDLKIRVAMASVKEKAQQAGVDDLEYAIYAPPKRTDMQLAWRITEALFLALRDEAQSHRAEFRIVTLATRPQVIPDPVKRAELLRQLAVTNFDYADERIREFGEREGIPVIALAPVLSHYAETQHAYLNGFNKTTFGKGHWNESGHRLAAAVIAGALCKDESLHSTAQAGAQR